MNVVLEVDRLRFGYDLQPVLDEISFLVREGESVGIAGANGSGKSTLLWCIAGLLRNAGRVLLFGEPPGRKSRSRLGMVFQNPEDQLFMPTLAQDLALPLITSGMEAPAARRTAVERLGEFGLEKYCDRPATHLSLGQRKRAAIALALVGQPELLLLDEPTAELDGRAVRQLADTLRKIGTARLIASHHLEFLRGVTTRMLILSEGRIIADGRTPEILADEALQLRAGLV